MSEKIRTIRLYGKLGTKYGRVHKLAVNSVAEAIRALSVLLPGFKQELMGSRAHGIAYAVFHGKQNIGREQLDLPPGNCDIRIAPVLQGSKRAGALNMIVGAVLVVVGAILTYTGVGSAIGVPMMKLGAVMMLGGVVTMLSAQSTGLSSKDSPANGASYNFNGPVNTSAQGNPVPVLYGRMIVGSAVISAGMYAEDQA